MRDLVVDSTYTIVRDLEAAHAAGEPLTITPLQCAVLASKLAKNRSSAAPYLEAAVRQVGGRLHLETRHLLVSTGAQVKYRPDVAAGRGGLLYIGDDPDAVARETDR